MLAFDDGYSYAEIAHILLLGYETIRRHIKDYFKHRKLWFQGIVVVKAF